MKYNIKVKPGSKKEKVEISSTGLTVWIKEQPEKGKANNGVIQALKKYFKVPKSNIQIISGFTSKNKVIEIEK